MTLRPPRLVLASDKFKGSLTAAQVADAIEAGVRRRWLALAATGRVSGEVEIVRSPVADGGDGTLAAAVAAGFTRVPLVVTGPLGDPVSTAWAQSGSRAVVELAECSGLLRLPSAPSSWTAREATTVGTGEAVAAAVTAGCDDILLGVGGSCSTDGGTGLLLALGALFSSSTAGGTALRTAASVDLAPVRRRLRGVRLRVATDVDAPLLGPTGAAAVFGPQKGATVGDVADLENELAQWADTLDAAAGIPLDSSPRTAAGAGAAGGTAYGALAGAEAWVTSGAEAVLDLVGFASALDDADLVVTGEGSLDEQSLQGKAPLGVLEAARARGIPVVAVCGRTTLPSAALATAGFADVYAIVDREPDVERAIADAAEHLVVFGELIAERLAAQRKGFAAEG